jgi:hypothetical protein
LELVTQPEVGEEVVAVEVAAVVAVSVLMGLPLDSS